MERKFGNVPLRKGSAVPDWGVCMLLYGPAGSGKTPIAATAVNSERFGYPMLYVDAEAGTKSISHYDNIDFVDVSNWAHVDNIMNELGKGTNPFKCVVFDNISELREIHMQTAVRPPGGKPQIQHWGENTTGILQWIRKCRDMSRTTGITFILIAWDTDVNDEFSGVLEKNLNLTPSLRDTVPGIIDLIGYIEVERDGTRIINFQQSRRLVSKFRRNRSENAIQIPLQIAVRDPDMPVLADLLDVLKGNEEWPKDKYTLKKEKESDNK